MLILSHRGFWKTESEKNTISALNRSIGADFGLETDIRDLNGDLVISHDIPTIKSTLLVDELFKIYAKSQKNLPLALNIKADGLQSLLKVKIEQYKIDNYFVFDMSLPESLVYLKSGFKIFTRQSEIEKIPMLYNESEGVWLDSFYNDWVNERTIEDHLNKGKSVCIVSPDLHKRDYNVFWTKLSKMSIIKNDSIMLCTDYPDKGRLFFNGKN